MKLLIVNADDFGLTKGVNRAIIDGHLGGIITSATMMVTARARDDAVARLADAPLLSVGCHLVLVDGKPAARPSFVRSLVDTTDSFPKTFSSFLLNLSSGRAKIAEIELELRAQIEEMLALGIEPSHLDSHKHTHAHPKIADIVLRLAEQYRIKCVRNPYESAFDNKVAGVLSARRLIAAAMLAFKSSFMNKIKRHNLFCPQHFHGFVVTGRLGPENILSVLEKVEQGVNELMCHPGFLDDELQDMPTKLRQSRERELAAVKSEQARLAVAKLGIKLTSFAALRSEKLI
ncbi:MAG: ChbG/HpnK family deacetylase [Acidobacteriota bacterium]|nr:ChbG/HpnK family deacetylase [Blastocatellia bacterium]MDW8412350.1 ChbG/HpnK family deacetylase [Acidobacteriota bacterium]